LWGDRQAVAMNHGFIHRILRVSSHPISIPCYPQHLGQPHRSPPSPSPSHPRRLTRPGTTSRQRRSGGPPRQPVIHRIPARAPVAAHRPRKISPPYVAVAVTTSTTTHTGKTNERPHDAPRTPRIAGAAGVGVRPSLATKRGRDDACP
jgi:hypothetical protein